MGELWEDIWDGIEDAELYDRGRYMQPGFSGDVEIKKVIGKATRKSGLALIIELRVLTTNLPDLHPVGQQTTWYQGLRDPNVAFPAITEWAAACAGYDPTRDKDQIKEELQPELKRVLSNATKNPEDNIFVGCKVHLETSLRTTQKNQPFTRYEWNLPHG